VTARELSLASCEDCSLLVRLPPDQSGTCPRCRAVVHSRKVESIARAWAFIVSAAILYVPANTFPIMTTTSLGASRSDTIMSGVLYLFKTEWPLAVVVFTASVMVPLLKLLILGYLLYSVQRGSRWRPVDRTRLYRITEGIGRWSMVDIYVVTILVALVRLGELASVHAEIGAIFFGSVVVLTMFAAQSFDPRLIWDVVDQAEAEPAHE
jgi:paraquat-inducible protein A